MKDHSTQVAAAASAVLTPELVVWAYQRGYFPMAESRNGPVHWYTADPRAILPLDGLRVSRSLRKRILREEFIITTDAAFQTVIAACAQPRTYEDETWINPQIADVFNRLHQLGLAHSIEAWVVDQSQTSPTPTPAQSRTAHRPIPRSADLATTAAQPAEPVATAMRDHQTDRQLDPQADPQPLPPPAIKPHPDATLVGGLYGVALGGAFFGESMFHRKTDASKVCLVHLVSHLNERGFKLLDTQLANQHMAQFGVIEISREKYLAKLDEALAVDAEW